MIRSAYLAPSEIPITDLQVKRALLTYDRVLIADPNDRDLFPPQAFLMAMGLPPFMGMNVGPVRPLAKSADYDRRFDQLIEQIDPARRQGLVDIISSYDLTTSSQTTMGAVLTGGYPLNPQLLLWAFRSIAREQSVLNAALEGDDQLMGLPDEQIEALSVGPAKADGGINDDPALPLLERSLARDHLRESLTLIARGRIAATMKSIGY